MTRTPVKYLVHVINASYYVIIVDGTGSQTVRLLVRDESSMVQFVHNVEVVPKYCVQKKIIHDPVFRLASLDPRAPELMGYKITLMTDPWNKPEFLTQKYF